MNDIPSAQDLPDQVLFIEQVKTLIFDQCFMLFFYFKQNVSHIS